MEIKRTNIRAWSMLGQRGAVFGSLMPELAKADPRIKLLTADLSLLSGMERYIKECPDQFLNVGIAEQNMVGISAGLAMEGYKVFATTYASFIAVRSLEHVRQHLGHLKCDVKLIASSGGVVASKSGISHWATEDIAFIRAIPGIEVYSPADALEAVKVVEYVSKTSAPAYIRLSGAMNCPIVYSEDFEWTPAKNRIIREGGDVAVLATGMMVSESLKAADILSEKGINAEVTDVSSIAPMDEEYLKDVCGRVPLLVTVEEHGIRGGLGGAVAEIISGYEGSPRLVRLGITDYMDRLGSYDYVLEQQGLKADGIASDIEAAVRG